MNNHEAIQQKPKHDPHYISNAIENSELFIVENEPHFSTLNPETADKIRSFLQNIK